jgi:hemin uptake protein HemP
LESVDYANDLQLQFQLGRSILPLSAGVYRLSADRPVAGAGRTGGDQVMSSQQGGSGSDREFGKAPAPRLAASSDTARPSLPADSDGIRYVTSSDLFAGAREVVIQHEQHRYRLKITSKGGMILNK